MTVATIEQQQRPVALLDKSTDSWVAVLTDVVQLATNIANTEFVPTGLRGSVPKVVAAIMHGRELGLPPMTALAQTFVIGGRPGTYAEMQRALILAAGHQFRITEQTVSRCVMKCRRSDWADGEWATYSFTIEEATRAGYTRTNANYQKVPADMLLARCTGRMAKGTFPDVIHGLATVEELMDLDESGTPDGALPPAPQLTTTVARQSVLGRMPADESAPAAGGAADGADATAEAAAEQRPAASAPGRKRAPLKPRGAAASAPAPADPPPAPVQDLPAEEPDVVDAEVVEEPPADEPAPAGVTPLAQARGDLRRKNIASIVMHFDRLLGKDASRDERIWWTRILVGNADIQSTNDLSTDEVRTALAKLEKLRNREHLEGLVGKDGE